MGQFAHEVKQPIAATVTNAQAALRFLGARAVDLNEIRNIFLDIVKDGNRAGEIINRIRGSHQKGAAPEGSAGRQRSDPEVIELTRPEATKNNVSVRTELADQQFSRPIACGVHGFERVNDEIKDHLLQFYAIASNERQPVCALRQRRGML